MTYGNIYYMTSADHFNGWVMFITILIANITVLLMVFQYKKDHLSGIPMKHFGTLSVRGLLGLILMLIPFLAVITILVKTAIFSENVLTALWLTVIVPMVILLMLSLIYAVSEKAESIFIKKYYGCYIKKEIKRLKVKSAWSYAKPKLSELLAEVAQIAAEQAAGGEKNAYLFFNEQMDKVEEALQAARRAREKADKDFKFDAGVMLFSLTRPTFEALFRRLDYSEARNLVRDFIENEDPMETDAAEGTDAIKGAKIAAVLAALVTYINAANAADAFDLDDLIYRTHMDKEEEERVRRINWMVVTIYAIVQNENVYIFRRGKPEPSFLKIFFEKTFDFYEKLGTEASLASAALLRWMEVLDEMITRSTNSIGKSVDNSLPPYDRGLKILYKG